MNVRRLMMLTLSVSVFLFIHLSANAGAHEGTGYTVIPAAELKRMLESGQPILVVDTFAASTYEQGHIPGAKNFEFPNGNMDEWNKSKTAGKSKDDYASLLGEDKERPLVFYCLDEK